MSYRKSTIQGDLDLGRSNARQGLYAEALSYYRDVLETLEQLRAESRGTAQDRWNEVDTNHFFHNRHGKNSRTSLVH
jgi:hypothetical protein